MICANAPESYLVHNAVVMRAQTHYPVSVHCIEGAPVQRHESTSQYHKAVQQELSLSKTLPLCVDMDVMQTCAVSSSSHGNISRGLLDPTCGIYNPIHQNQSSVAGQNNYQTMSKYPRMRSSSHRVAKSKVGLAVCERRL